MRLDEETTLEPYVNKRMAQCLRLVAAVFPCLSWLAVLVTTCGQIFRSPFAAQTASAATGMAVLTSLALACLATALLGARHRRSAIFPLLSWVAFLISVIVIASYSVAGDDVVNPRLARWLLGPSAPVQLHCSIATALCIALLSIAQLRRAPVYASISDYLAGTTVLISGAALLAYLFKVPDLHHIFIYSTMAVPTAVAIWLLAIATIAADSSTGWAALISSARAAGSTTRRHLVLSHIPIVLVGVALHGIRSGYISTESAMTFLVVLIMAPMIVLIFKHGKAQENREKTDQALERFRLQSASAMKIKLGEQAVALQKESEIRREAESGINRAQRLEAIGHLTGGIAHDFNNLLMAIGTTLNLLGRQIFPGHPGRPYIERLVATTERGARLAKQLLVFSRTQTIDVRAVPLDAAIVGARELIGSALGPNIQIVVELNTKDIWVRTDPDQLQLAILNMAINARDAMPHGGELRITTEAVIEIVAGHPHEMVRVRMADTGVGMSAEVSARAIEPFFTTKAAGDGTGLGLSQVYGVMKQSGGELRIESWPGHGTTIDLLFIPAEPAANDVEEITEQNPRRSVLNAHAVVLLIDDDDEVRMAMAELFRCDGHEVIEANSGQAGLDLLQTRTPSIAIIDYLMPGLNGAQVAMIARERLPLLPIVFVSGYADTLALESISGARVLRKPVDLNALLAIVADFG